MMDDDGWFLALICIIVIGFCAIIIIFCGPHHGAAYEQLRAEQSIENARLRLEIAHIKSDYAVCKSDAEITKDIARIRLTKPEVAQIMVRLQRSFDVPAWCQE